ncbi:MAG: 3-oxoacyl-ACP reductase [Candidatus Nealsonbacteria bacterium CG08_land_8_20_14_0_20_38_20]|uniref:3-oxoacyl-ACP reductase n=1 Tax=Candidatus Nealsonbacteria bacterium CG08_land_8_20_14_0_20_38_20 TaxID=1974705 RepID=A0A2H0YPI2_9BACT|nr:MAG: 3-oxoacyl-ACP reductase [Candidatus Nealsonbacteria bacterium CG08_land_8_20_14_0_20_38_20]
MFKDKVILITGSSQGIGRAIALKFASLGAKIALNDIPAQEENLKRVKEETEKKLTESGSPLTVRYFLADVSKLDEVEKMVESIKKEFGRLDVLVNNAGTCQDRTLAKMTKEEWQRVIDIDLTGVFNCSKAALPLLIAGQGKIINISSVVGQRGNFGQTNYAAAKAGIIGFTKSLAKEVGRLGVTVNAVAPGFIDTKLTESVPEQIRAAVKQLTALGRLGKPEEIANLVAFLASGEASFITGAVINIDGGLAI